jgi:hypothetical protein
VGPTRATQEERASHRGDKREENLSVSAKAPGADRTLRFAKQPARHAELAEASLPQE